MPSRRTPVRVVVVATLLAVAAAPVAAQPSVPAANAAAATAQPKATEAELRDMALFLARVDKATRDKNLKAYCDAAMASPSYRGYIRGYCVALARNEKRDPATCSDARVSEMMRQEYAQCLANPSPDFARLAQSSVPAKELLIKEAASVGMDGRRLLDEATVAVK